MKAKQTSKLTAIPPLPPATGSGLPLLCRLAQLYKELKEAERGFDADGNDEASCATYAAAERLREIVNEYCEDTPNTELRRGEKD